MTNVRALAERDLGHTLEREMGIAVALIAPDGLKISTTNDGRPLVGRVLWSQPRTNTESGEVVIVPDPVVELRRSSLSRVPLTGEHWSVIIPSGPTAGAPLEIYMLDASRSLEGGRNLGVIKLPLQRVKQAVP
ncbi:MAG: hypothetical protein KKB59_10530 [Spirochaetes bacterium]|nr:hypothetical protein [Spirochaetota bacterium]